MSQREKRSAPRFGVYRPTAADAFEMRGADADVAGETVRFASWNIHWGAGATLDDGRRFSVSQVERSLSEVVRWVSERQVDVLAIQEVDRDSHRSANIDQLEHLRELCGLRHVSFATTWDASWVPYPVTAPPSQQYGRMWSGQAVLSRFPILSQRRHALPQPAKNGWFYNRFYLHRCAQEVRLDLGLDRQLTVFNVHLEAFDMANRRAQARILARLLRRHRGLGLALGDFNALALDAEQRSGFVDEPDTSFHGDDTLQTLAATSWALAGGSEHTFPSSAPNRRLDHVLLSPGSSGEVQDPTPCLASDHLPLFGELEI